MSNEGKPISELLRQMMRTYKMEQKLDEVNIASCWKEIAGDMIAKHTREVGISNGTLFVTVDSPSLKNELQYHKSVLLQKVNAHLNNLHVAKIVIR